MYLTPLPCRRPLSVVAPIAATMTRDVVNYLVNAETSSVEELYTLGAIHSPRLMSQFFALVVWRIKSASVRLTCFFIFGLESLSRPYHVPYGMPS